MTTNGKLIASFKQLDNDQEKQRAFRRLLFDEALVKYSSALLVLVEALRNIDRFQSLTDTGRLIKQRFEKYVDELSRKAGALGLKPMYIPLFSDYSAYAGHAKLSNDSLSSIYQQVRGLQKDDVAEVVSYGFETAFGKTDTLIIFK